MNSKQRRNHNTPLEDSSESSPPGHEGGPEALRGHKGATASLIPDNDTVASNGFQGGPPMGTETPGRRRGRRRQADAAKAQTDPFDLDSLRLRQDFASSVGVKRLLTTIPIRKPSKEWFVRNSS